MWRFLFVVALLSGLSVTSGSQVRLIGGKHVHEGRIEVKYDGEWRAICDHKWNLKAASVVCRMLGFPGALRFTKGETPFGRGDGKFWLDDVICGGREYDIERCSHRDWGRHNCRSINQAGVICKLHRNDVISEPEPSQASGEVVKVKLRLLGPIVDDYISEGVVQVKHEGEWGYICPSSWTPVNSHVLCGQLGFPKTEELESYSETVQDVEPVYWLDQVTCRGWESSIVSCDHAGWNRHQCKVRRAVKIKCVRKNTIQTSPEIRLRSGALVSEGRVEVKESNTWGSICDDHWTLKEANVVCRSLGYGSAAMAAKNAYFGRGIGEKMMHDVHCQGTERNLGQCKHKGWQTSVCNHYEDASVRCHVPQLQGHKIRLTGGANSYEGRVEVFHGGRWGTVCADDWRIEEAMVVCRQLNLGYARRAATRNYFGPTRLRVTMSGVICRVDEISIFNCQHDNWENATCSSRRKLAGVICVDALPDLIIDTVALAQEMHLHFQILDKLRCALEENCLATSADRIKEVHPRSWYYYSRKLLRFTTKIENRGWDDFRPNAPRSSWDYHQCHAHYHSMETFASYDLLTQNDSTTRAQGHKASFCLEDTECDPGFEKNWNCTRGGDQGISPGCFDIYSSKIDCQWIDCTDIRTKGLFLVRVQLNPGNQVAESDFRNNIAKCSVKFSGRDADVNKCWIENCESGVDTHGGNSSGACCVFPFKFNGKLYHSCTTGRTTDGMKWCATTDSYSRDKKWGLCFN